MASSVLTPTSPAGSGMRRTARTGDSARATAASRERASQPEGLAQTDRFADVSGDHRAEENRAELGHADAGIDPSQDVRRGDCLAQADLIDIVDRQRGVGHDLLADEEQHPDRVRRGGQRDERLTDRGQQERRDHDRADPETGQAAGDHRAEKQLLHQPRRSSRGCRDRSRPPG